MLIKALLHASPQAVEFLARMDGLDLPFYCSGHLLSSDDRFFGSNTFLLSRNSLSGSLLTIAVMLASTGPEP